MLRPRGAVSTVWNGSRAHCARLRERNLVFAYIPCTHSSLAPNVQQECASSDGLHHHKFQHVTEVTQGYQIISLTINSDMKQLPPEFCDLPIPRTYSTSHAAAMALTKCVSSLTPAFRTQGHMANVFRNESHRTTSCTDPLRTAAPCFFFLRAESANDSELYESQRQLWYRLLFKLEADADYVQTGLLSPAEQ